MDNSNTSVVLEFLRYNNWANGQIFDMCEKLDAEGLSATAPGSYGTIRDTLAHMVLAEASYTHRLGGNLSRPPFTLEDKPDVLQMRAYAEEVGAALLEVVSRGNPSNLVREEEDGNFVEYLALGLWMQAVLHGVEHRTNITTILQQINRRPPEMELDSWGYMWNHQEKFHWKEGKTNE